MTEVHEPPGRIALALGPAGAILIAGVLSGVRSSVGTTNVALLLACLVVAAGIAGRSAGVATAITAAISYNFFHTQPYGSLRIDAGTDTLTVLLLAVIGIVVSEMGARHRHAAESSRRHLNGEHTLERIAGRIAAGADSSDVWSDVRSTLIAVFDLVDCRFVPGEQCDVAILPRSGSLLAHEMRWGRGGFELPASGVALTVASAGHVHGHMVMTPRGHDGSTIDARQVAIALADLYALALTLASSRR